MNDNFEIGIREKCLQFAVEQIGSSDTVLLRAQGFYEFVMDGTCTNGKGEIVDRTMHREETFFIVRKTLMEAGYTEVGVTEIIEALTNAGILFRERVPEDG